MDDGVNKIRQLKELLDEGLIDENEFKRKKDEILQNENVHVNSTTENFNPYMTNNAYLSNANSKEKSGCLVTGAKILLIVAILFIGLTVAFMFIDTDSSDTSSDNNTQTEEQISNDDDSEKPVYIGKSFEEIYYDYKANKARANKNYKGKRCKFKCKINGIENEGLLNLFGSATLTLEKNIDGTIVFFYASFEDENDIMNVNEGDVIRIDGQYGEDCSWIDCKIVKRY